MNKQSSQFGFWATRLGGVAVLLAGAIILWFIVRQQQAAVVALQHEREQVPQAELRLTTLNAQLKKYAPVVTTLEGATVIRDKIGDVIGVIEKEAVGRGVEVEFADITEKQVFDEQGQLAKQSGPIQLIQIKMVAVGEPEALLEFLYAVEHLPFLLHLDAWRLDSVAPVQPPRPSVSPEEEAVPLVGQVNADLVVGVRQLTDKE